MTARTLADFQIGDRVEVVDYDIPEMRSTFLNQCGTVAGYSGQWIVVDHDEAFYEGLDSCDGLVKSRRGWIYHPKELEIFIQDDPIPIDDLL